MQWNEAVAVLQEREYKSPCEAWTPAQKGCALEMIHLLANTPHKEWRTKKELHAQLSEFRNQ
jgi:hypothetical protein